MSDFGWFILWQNLLLTGSRSRKHKTTRLAVPGPTLHCFTLSHAGAVLWAELCHLPLLHRRPQIHRGAP